MYKLLILVYINYAAAALESRIVDGRNARSGEFGYIVSLHKYYHHACGGAIINEYNVITAAHCIGSDMKYHHVIYGVIKLRRDGLNTIEVRNAFIHKSFNPTKSIPKHDIAILRLTSPIPLDSSNARPIPLPTQGEEFRTNTWARVGGWGWINKVADNHSTELKVTTVYFLQPKRCEKLYGSDFRKKIQLCVGKERDGRDRRATCLGDAGSPLVKITKGKEKLAGVLGGRLPPELICRKKKYPDLFTKVSHYVNWIEEQLSKD